MFITIIIQRHYHVVDMGLYCTELVMDNRPLVGPMGQAYLKSDEYGKIYRRNCALTAWILRANLLGTPLISPMPVMSCTADTMFTSTVQ